MSRARFWFLLAFVGVLSVQSESARILGLFTSPAKSHLIIHSAIADALAERGHDLTVLTTIPLGKRNPPYRHIQLEITPFSKKFLVKTINESEPFYKQFVQITTTSNRCNNDTMHNPIMRKLLDEEQFDLVIFGYFFNDFLLGIPAHFNCPVVVSFMVQPIWAVNQLVGNPLEVAYVPNLFTGEKQPLSFLSRVKNFVLAGFERAMIRLYLEDQQKALYNYNFPPDKYPSLDEMRKNISLVLTNHHFSQGPIRPNVPGMVEIGGIQIKDKPDPLPEDIRVVLDNAKHGVIYFSFGSNVQGSFLDKTKAKIMFDVLSKVPQTVLWKWGESDFPGQSPNIVYKSWVPQDDVLAHPNVKLFVTHGGQGSVVESEYHGVPMVGVPLFGEQHVNMANVQAAGYGVSVDFATMTVESFGAAIKEVLSNPRYRDSVKQFATLYKDRPMTAKQTAVFWVEYVLRHRGAPHMQSPAVHLNTLQLMSLDVLAFLAAVIYLVYKVIRLSCSCICRSSKRRLKQE